jgi:hypothetical protein
MFNLRNPAIRYRIMWAQERTSYGRVSPQAKEESEPKLAKPLYDGTMLVATVAGPLIAAVTAVFQFHLV